MLKHSNDQSNPLTNALQLALSAPDSAQRHFWEICADQLLSEIYLVAFSFFPDDSYAEDVVQDIFLKLMHIKLHRLPSNNEAHLRAYLLRVAINHCKDNFRIRKKHRKRFKSTDLISNHPSLNSGREESGPGFSARKLLEENLTSEQQEVIILLMEKWSYQDIAEELNLSTASVKNRIFRARKRLEKRLFAA